MARVEVADVDLAPADDLLLAAGIDTPRAGLATDGFGLDLRGWAVGRRSPAVAVELVSGGVLLAEVPVEGERSDVAALHPEPEWSQRSGFFAPIGTLALEQEFELDLRVRFENAPGTPLARIAGRRERLRSGFAPRLEPIALTALGRTGSTAVARLLAAHPEIVAYRPFEYEPRVISYWLGVLGGLAEPASFRRQVMPNGPLEGSWWLGERKPPPGRIKDEELQAWIGGESVEELAAFCQSRIDGFYTRVAGLAGREGASYFVEKCSPGATRLLAELYPRSKEVFLVRDFRDMVASILAYNERRSFAGFGRDRFASDADYVSGWVADSVARFVRDWRARSEHAHLLRYEDLLERPREAVGEMLDDLGLEHGDATLDAMLASLSAPDSDSHRTTSAPDSIGRWSRDLAPDVQEACAGAFKAALAEFGYEA
jgi:hypothetical protein